MEKSKSTRKQPNFLSAAVFIFGLTIVNIIVILINDTVHSDWVTFIGNTIGIGLLFPASLLYIERKEKFNLKRFLYFFVLTAVATGILMYWFVVRPKI